MYEYKSITIGSNDSISYSDVKELNEYYSKGWEYVDGIAQVVSRTGQYGDTKYGTVLITLRRLKDEDN
jgi:hypothetical protein